MGEITSYDIRMFVVLFAFFAGLLIIGFLLARRILRAYAGDKGIDVPATIAFVIVSYTVFICAIASWVAYHAPD